MCFVLTEYLLLLEDHETLTCLGHGCNQALPRTQDALLGHCVRIGNNCFCMLPLQKTEPLAKLCCVHPQRFLLVCLCSGASWAGAGRRPGFEIPQEVEHAATLQGNKKATNGCCDIEISDMSSTRYDIGNTGAARIPTIRIATWIPPGCNTIMPRRLFECIYWNIEGIGTLPKD